MKAIPIVEVPSTPKEAATALVVNVLGRALPLLAAQWSMDERRLFGECFIGAVGGMVAVMLGSNEASQDIMRQLAEGRIHEEVSGPLPAIRGPMQ